MILCQVNLAWLKHPRYSDEMAEFWANLERVNTLGDQAPGFLWRYKEGQDATGVIVMNNPKIVYNCSAWTSLEALRDYVYSEPHREMMKKRRDWFQPPPLAPTCCWLQGDDCPYPSVTEALEHLTHFWVHGPSPAAFDLRGPYA